MRTEYYFQVYLEKFCLARGLAPKTILTYAECLEQFADYIESVRAEKGISNLKTEDICDYIEYLKISKNNGTATINKKVTILRSFYQAMISFDLIEPNADPCRLLPKLKKSQEKVGDILSIEEIEKLAVAPNSDTLLGIRDRAMLLLLCTTGIRASECAGIKECDIDLPNRMIRVLGKGNRERVVMLNDVCVLAIENYIRFRGKQKAQELFFKVRTGKGLDRKRIYDRVKYYLRKARIFKKISPHRLRHSFATKMIKDGVKLATLKELLGHRNIQSTMRYVQVSGEELRAAINRLNIDDTFEKLVLVLPIARLRYQKSMNFNSS